MQRCGYGGMEVGPEVGRGVHGGGEVESGEDEEMECRKDEDIESSESNKRNRRKNLVAAARTLCPARSPRNYRPCRGRYIAAYRHRIPRASCPLGGGIRPVSCYFPQLIRVQNGFAVPHHTASSDPY